MDPAFHFDAVSDPDPTVPKYYTFCKIKFSFHSSVSNHCFIFLVSVIGVIVFNYFVQYTEVFWKKESFALHLLEKITYPALDPPR